MPGALTRSFDGRVRSDQPRGGILWAVEILTYAVPEWGVGELWLRAGVVVNHELPRPGRPAVSRPVRASPLHGRLAAYFGGEVVAFDDVELDVGTYTPFQRAVVDALRAVPYGETATYGELAALAGHPGAHRAVGTVCAHNRFPLLVPCHRVVSATSIGPYGELGTEYKRRLLALEAGR